METEDNHEYNSATRFSSTNQPKKRRGRTKPVRDAVLSMVMSEKPLELDATCICPHCGKQSPAVVKLPTLQAIIAAQMLKARAGDSKAYQLLTERLEGRPIQPIAVEEPNEEAYDFSQLTDDELATLTELLTRCQIDTE